MVDFSVDFIKYKSNAFQDVKVEFKRLYVNLLLLTSNNLGNLNRLKLFSCSRLKLRVSVPSPDLWKNERIATNSTIICFNNSLTFSATDFYANSWICEPHIIWLLKEVLMSRPRYFHHHTHDAFFSVMSIIHFFPRFYIWLHPSQCG